jgi:predicted O-methyltransferase YrrM
MFWNSRSYLSKAIFDKVGVFPIINHYYEPYYSFSDFKRPLNKIRSLPGINFKLKEQLELISHFKYSEELKVIDRLPNSQINYSFKKGPFLSGDSEILFDMIRFYKPKRIIEIGCGHSTLMIQHALSFNFTENSENKCKHICVEPFGNDWLLKLDVEVIRDKVEEIDLGLFSNLEEGDFLFIDSTHMIRPQGDVLFEYLELLPSLKSGVIIHIHDIFTPRDYLEEWLKNGKLFWNEQYLLEAFLSFNSKFEVLISLNYLKNEHFDKLKDACPFLTNEREPGSFWIKKL